MIRPIRLKLALLVICMTAISACGSASAALPGSTPEAAGTAANGPTPLPTRSPHPPGEIFTYPAQSGDTLDSVAAHFNTSVREIRAANPDLPSAVTTLPPGYPLQVPAYYTPLTGSPFHILPDSEVVDGPPGMDFDLQQYVQETPGYLSGMESFAYKKQRKAWEVVQVIAENYSLNPRLLLALLEYRTGALSNPDPDPEYLTYPMDVKDIRYRGLFWQLVWVAERLNDGYYGWRTGELDEIQLLGGLVERPDPWLNAGTVALHRLFADMYQGDAYDQAVSPEGFYQTYLALWGEPFDLETVLIPGSLQQPEMGLPFLPNRVWDFSGGPHFSWGTSLPIGALDFAPPAAESGCVESSEWIAAPADGVITRSGEAIVMLDLDGDGDERTGWVVFFFHVAAEGRIATGTQVKRGDTLGHPSCEGGRATGTHVHIARKYNGEWIPATGPLGFVLDGWVAAYGGELYEGTLTKGSKVVPACTCSRPENQILYTLP
jgi:murein DD-endopeptidase MepM/ murein hydrolase activator NlpD